MPNIDTTLVGYVAGEYVYTTSEGEYTEYETEFVPDWRIDEDPRKVTSYITTQTETMMDRRNDEYLSDVKSFVMPKDPVEKDVLFGYTLVPCVGDRIVRCWYCNPSDAEFSYREFVALCPQAYDARHSGTERSERAFCYAMLEHYQGHRDAVQPDGSTGDLPYVTTYFPGRTILRPNGEVAAQKPGVTRTWQIKGNLLGASQNWFDPTQRQESIAAREEWAALVE